MGIYLCEKCEEIANNIDKVKFNILGKNGFYTNEGLRDPSGSFLGYGGSYFILKYIDGKVNITNSLFSDRSMHHAFYEKIKHRINCDVIHVNDFNKNTLSNYLNANQINSLQDSLLIAKKLGLKTDYFQ